MGRQSTTEELKGTMNREMKHVTTMTTFHKAHERRTVYFLRHLLEMMLAMLVGMVVLGIVYDQLIGALGYADPIESFPKISVLVSAFNMSLPMVAWMRYRGHSWYKSLEMAGAMFIPTLPLFVLFEAGTISALALNHLPHAFMCPSMLVVMLLRRDEYSCDHRARTKSVAIQATEVGETA